MDLSCTLGKEQIQDWSLEIISEPTQVTPCSCTLYKHTNITSHPSDISHISVPVYAASDYYPVCITWISLCKADAEQISYQSMKFFDENTCLTLNGVTLTHIHVPMMLSHVGSLCLKMQLTNICLLYIRVKCVNQPKWMEREKKLHPHQKFLEKDQKSRQQRNPVEEGSIYHNMFHVLS